MEISPERVEYLKQFDAWVRILIKSKLRGFAYQDFLYELLRDWLLWCDARNSDTAKLFRHMHGTWNNDSGLGNVWVNGEYVFYCKFYLEDGTDSSRNDPRKGVLIRDHNDGVYDVQKVHLIADSLEEFLKERKQSYERVNLPARF